MPSSEDAEAHGRRRGPPTESWMNGNLHVRFSREGQQCLSFTRQFNSYYPSALYVNIKNRLPLREGCLCHAARRALLLSGGELRQPKLAVGPIDNSTKCWQNSSNSVYVKTSMKLGQFALTETAPHISKNASELAYFASMLKGI